MKPKSDNLFHFTQSLDILELILKDGFFPRYCLEDVRWMGLESIKYIAFPMTCFCDIPLSRISEHTGFYGNYGLGMTKEWGEKNNLNPVVYSPPSGRIQELMKFLFNTETENFDEDFEKQLNVHTYKLWSLIKPTIGNMLISSEIIEKEFYQESEWRYVPEKRNIIVEDEFEENKESLNHEMEEYKILMSPNDIKYIFVQSDSDIPRLVDFINNNLGNYPLNDLKILQSRIVSLDTLNSDL